MPTNLTDLPQEIRDMIWNELLLDDTENRLKHRKISTQLFQVNKAISADTLAFFYRENAFVLIEDIDTRTGCFLSHLLDSALLTKSRCHMTFLLPDMEFPPKVALRIKLLQGYNKAVMGGENKWEETVDRRSKQRVVQVLMPGKYLPRLIQTINCTRSPFYYVKDYVGPPIFGMKLDFETELEEYYQGNGVAQRLVDGLKGLLQFQGYDWYSNWRGFNSARLITGPTFNTEFTITGLDDKLATELLQNSDLPMWTRGDVIAKSKHLIQQAKTHEARGDYAEAYLDLYASQLMIGHHKVRGFMNANLPAWIGLEITSILFDILFAYSELAWNLRSEYREFFLRRFDVESTGEISRAFGKVMRNSPRHPYLRGDRADEGHLKGSTLEDLKARRSTLFLRYSRYALSIGDFSNTVNYLRLALAKDLRI
ncbi:hypothetical protein HYALB_00012896 [Hymenoscyphus albidus]|uniref:Uncharacterized protein n=1 Tax=Hymenoscyphus albidus TaxID=595503 RepID=A0A9N9LUC8_9HELO|nr:hypothetical protein HYALB_00012896 [Hymenoscyphus albidus]